MIAASISKPSAGMESQQNVKLKRAATEFESVLLASWLEQLRQSYSLDAEQEALAGGDNMRSMATQAVATAMAARGGIGIAQLMYERLQQR